MLEIGPELAKVLKEVAEGITLAVVMYIIFKFGGRK